MATVGSIDAEVDDPDLFLAIGDRELTSDSALMLLTMMSAVKEVSDRFSR